MAQIRIEEKKSGSILPWILGLLLLALGIWGISELFDEGDPTEYDLSESVLIEDDPDFPGTDLRDVADVGAEVDVDADTEVVSLYATDVKAYMDYTTEMKGEMGLDHEFSHEALTLLAAATNAVAEAYDLESETDAESKTNRVMKLADDITKDPYATNHADHIRMAALLITEILEDVDEQSYNSANAAELKMLRKEAQDITSEKLTLNQKEDVRSFFTAARNVLSRMS